ncbi:hypothetical protein [Aquimarina sediminis]|uniref:hypothetical protein n=1 Tax=Aquimarina sediminis TaxID=2070536 RepID=UPI000FFF50E3|nr:hypothetical protein [Aquimarina sediminis]
MAQNDMDVVGLYSLGSSSPEGGNHLFVLENGKFVITYFGGVQVGEWSLTSNTTILFTPDIKKNEFELYGRYNKNIGNTVRISFEGFEEASSFISLKKTKDDKHIMKKVFNENANCFNYPYVKNFRSTTETISFMVLKEEMETLIYDFNTKGFNDFIAFFCKNEDEAYPFYATFKHNRLYLDENGYSTKQQLPKEGEDIDFIRRVASKNASNKTILCNPSYHLFEGNINENHIFDKEKGAYINPQCYIEGDEFMDKEEFFENMEIIYEYEALKISLSKYHEFRVDNTPIFITNCQ